MQKKPGMGAMVILVMFAIVAANFFRGTTKDASATSNTNVQSSTSSVINSSATSNISSQRLDDVRKIYEPMGARVDSDPSAVNTIRIYLPLSVAADITKSQAQVMASETRVRLSADAIVYVKSPAGMTLAKAAPWGVE